MEVTVLDDLGLGLEVAHIVDVREIAGEGLALHGEGSGVEDVDLAGLELGLGGVDGFLGALGGDSLVDLGELNGAGGDGAGPVGVDGLAVHGAVNDVLEVGLPVDTGGHDEGVGAGRDGGAVVADVGHTGLLAGGGSTHGVGMLAEQDAAVLDELVGSLVLEGLVIPAVGEGDVHGHGGADALGAEIEGGVAGLDFRIGIRADIAHLGLISGDLAGLDHLVELHTGSDAGEVTALIDGSKRVVIVVKALGVRLGAGGMAELHVGELLGSLDHEVLMTEAVGEDQAAATVREIRGGLIALLALGDVGAQLILHALRLAGSLGGVHKVLVVGGVFVMQEDEADLEFGCFIAAAVGGLVAAAGAESENHNHDEKQSGDFLHVRVS